MDCKQTPNETSTQPVGIVTMQCYFPKLYVSQSKLEIYDNVTGKYTKGLGQIEMSFVTEWEDNCSLQLTVLRNLMLNNPQISYKDIGWLCCASETILDHSKSYSSMLMQLFAKHGNNDVEGVDVKHACYAGTFALFSAIDHCSSYYWDGRYAVVICSDIAIYEAGNARCTGGAGAIALLIGNQPCITLEKCRATFKAHQYDFYKPNLSSPYPIVNGLYSQQCFLFAIDECYKLYISKLKAMKCNMNGNEFSPMEDINYWIFHSPYNKLVQKAFSRIIFNDFMQNKNKYFIKCLENTNFHSQLKEIADYAMDDELIFICFFVSHIIIIDCMHTVQK